jgi:hypothetical protein
LDRLVVEVLREPLALLFVSLDELTEQVPALSVRQLQLGDLLDELIV